MAALHKWALKAFHYRSDPHRPPVSFSAMFNTFQRILELNNRILELMADMGDKLGGDYVFDRQYIISASRNIAGRAYELIYSLNTLAPNKYPKLDKAFRDINHDIVEELAGRLAIPQTAYVLPYEKIGGDLSDVVGGKNAHLAELKNRLGLTVPEGFAVTTRAFQSFLDQRGVGKRIEKTLSAWEAQKITTDEASRTISGLITAAPVPGPLHKAMEKALKQLRKKTGGAPLRLALRSSAMGEDSEHSFAGQYLSLLNEPERALSKCYREILAGAYTPQAMTYRRQKGFSEYEVAMAVACQRMVDAEASGVLYTMDPMDPGREVVVISAVWGLGLPVVSGETAADRFVISRSYPHATVSLDVVRKATRLVPAPRGGSMSEPLTDEMQTRMCLSAKQLKALAEAGLAIERYYKSPQDIEWAFDAAGELVILQTRPLNIKAQMAQVVCDIAAVTEQFPVIFSKKGEIVQNGIAVGKVFRVHQNEDLEHFPNGAILVARETSPRYARVARKAGGIITDVGTATGHMATIAREFRIPTIVNTGVATELLKPGQEITLDAQENVVYDGQIRELCYYTFLEDAFEESYEYRLLRRVLKKITPLNLVDPHARDFTPKACRTFHDLTRFVHEKAVEELIDFNYHRGLDSDTTRKKLKTSLPLDLIIIDISGGLKDVGEKGTIGPEQILSVPMQAFLGGLNAPGFWSNEPLTVDFGSFMSSLTRTFSAHQVSPRAIGQNLAVISREYANISLRLGYHFNLIDAYISEKVNDNYAYFRFMGGVTDPVRRSRRAAFIHEMLSRNNFNVDLRGDLVIGRIKKLSPPQMMHKMHLLGNLVGFTRQLDVRMTSDEQVDNFSQEFERLIHTEELTH
jgi:pyruvate,water dikinase